MVCFVGRRLASAISVVAMTLIATFTLFFVAPTDPAGAICGERRCTQQRYQEIQANLHLDRPKVQQFLEYSAGIIVGRTFETSGTTQRCTVPCLGFSFKNDRPVTEMLRSRLPVTMSLVAGYAVLVLTIGVAIGTIAARRHATISDRLLMAGTLVVGSIPYYVLALMTALYLTIVYPILPRSGYTPLTENPVQWMAGLLAPWLVLGIYGCASYARFARGSMIEVLGEDFIRTARAKGLPNRVVTYKHALRAGLIPIITIFGLDLAGSLTGAIFTERVFDLPGLGNLVLESQNNYDLPLIMGTVLLGSVILVAMNFLVDIVYGLIDPRIRST
ncbi:ABC transporter permease [Kribbella sp. NBC_01505]|uniref:ABC transporter permease n=1 Tax=Kribbella sp. NBC_01505 TaxID=2903580 RepID=UPI003867892D